jgi:hypothetical protein
MSAPLVAPPTARRRSPIMQHETEAQVLLRDGRAFRRRVGLTLDDGGTAFLGTKPGALALYLDDAPYYHLDLEGRWQRALIDGVHYVRALDGSADALERVREDGGLVLRRRRLAFAEIADLDERVRHAALDLLAGLCEGRIALRSPPEPAASIDLHDARDLLERVAGWDASAWFRHKEAYRAAYGTAPLPFLPPSCPQPIVLRRTIEHAPPGWWLFGPPERIEVEVASPAEFDAHCRAVARLLGRRAAQARGVVLAGAAALWAGSDTRTLRPDLDAVRRHFGFTGASEAPRPSLSGRSEDEPDLDGLYAFHAATGAGVSVDWAAARAAGLRHVDLGFVSGSDAVRRRHDLATPASDDVARMAALKAAGLQVGLVVPIGAGGREEADRHVADTDASLAGAPLDAGDILYLVLLSELLGPEGSERLEASRVSPLPPALEEQQRATLRAALRERLAGRGVKIVPYTVSKQALA